MQPRGKCFENASGVCIYYVLAILSVSSGVIYSLWIENVESEKIKASASVIMQG